MTYQNLDVSIEESVAIVTMARTESMNALSLAFAAEIAQAFRELGGNDEVRVIVLASRARAFCAGLDLKEFAAAGLKGSAKASLGFPAAFRPLFDCCDEIENCPKPVIAAVNGLCIGGGLDIVSACDIRLCTEDASFSLREAAIGLVADMGVLQRLPRVIGQGFTREMAFTARFYTAGEAKAMGLVGAVYPDGAAMMEGAGTLARQIAANAPLAVQATKDVLNASRHLTVQEGMSLAQHKNMVLLMSQDLKEAFASFREKRKPDFKGK
ncbi:MAG TPA: enoyl-CoA hydratase-related protein [Syntrophales bacterium]|nr:enoyl-CoA hydratase-related protein [Syntrophales bacterium]